MDILQFAQSLIAIPSVTDQSNLEIAELQASTLKQLGFEIEEIAYRDLGGATKVAIAAKHPGGTKAIAGRSVAFFGHNDVVSIDGWNCRHGGAFEGAVADSRLWGRGACDMKGPMAAATVAIARLDRSRLSAPLYFFVTGDEESGMVGMQTLVNQSEVLKQAVSDQAVAIIGEPTDLQIVNMHKGGCHFEVSSFGVVAHSSRTTGINANWQMIPFLTYLSELKERLLRSPEYRNEAFEPADLSLNFVIENRPCAPNITVGEAVCKVFFRPMPGVPWDQLVTEITNMARSMELSVSSVRSLPPLCTASDRGAIQKSLATLNLSQALAVSYATDACVLKGLDDVFVFGPGSIEQAHTTDEWIAIESLNAGAVAYQKLFEAFACCERSV